MRLAGIKISHFRGIQTCEVAFPKDGRVICLIGAGDSTKSTILGAIEYALWPSWNLPVYDVDFYRRDMSKPVEIEVSLAEVPSALLSEEKCGLYLRGDWTPTDDDEPKEDQPEILTIKLTIEEDLEPRWNIVCNRLEPKPIPYKDRRLLSLGSVGEKSDNDLSWGRFSILQQYGEARGVIKEAFSKTLRQAAQSADLTQLNSIAGAVKSIGREYGISLSENITNQLVVNNASMSSSVTLFDDDTPLKQRGKGSQRLLSMGLNIRAYEEGTLLLVDEVETGLEPYRLRNLINVFRQTHRDKGQVIMTTHSPVAVAECRAVELGIVHSDNGVTNVRFPNNNDQSDIQAIIRSNPEAMLSRRLIVCEGKTEIGFIRALDTYLMEERGYHMACSGVDYALGTGDDVLKTAERFYGFGYDVCVFMDSDKTGIENLKRMASNYPVFSWEEGNSIEEQVFEDCSDFVASELLQIAIEYRGLDSVKAKLRECTQVSFEPIRVKCSGNQERRGIGTIAKDKNSSWFKRIDFGESFGKVVFDNLNHFDNTSTTVKVVKRIVEWVRNG